MQVNRTGLGLAGLLATTGVLAGLLPSSCKRMPASPNPTDLTLFLVGGDDVQEGIAKFLSHELIMSDYSRVAYSGKIEVGSNISGQIITAKGDHIQSKADYLRDNREYTRFYFWNNKNGAVTEVKLLSNRIPQESDDSMLLSDVFTITKRGDKVTSIQLNKRYKNGDTTIRFSLTPWNDKASFEKPDLRYAWPFRGDELSELIPQKALRLPQISQKYPELD